ncbi:hypothetical protein GJ688_08520 [Heliobacillus mobilis]|uniref:Uncharacterized protein n=1 Tax=Heliobacterium mobile TaxID=28064 RepID=A0A6I3SJD3_HELMO|nr:hypothetical protein [Heliobacterium mobile]MTV49021.1 hypothetical protein [Heliobacterium mobile]
MNVMPYILASSRIVKELHQMALCFERNSLPFRRKLKHQYAKSLVALKLEAKALEQSKDELGQMYYDFSKDLSDLALRIIRWAEAKNLHLSENEIRTIFGLCEKEYKYYAKKGDHILLWIFPSKITLSNYICYRITQISSKDKDALKTVRALIEELTQTPLPSPD